MKFISIAVCVFAFALSACTKKEEVSNNGAASTTTTTTTTTTNNAAPAAASSQLKIEDLKVGTGAVAVAGKVIKAHYTGWLTDGKKFDSSLDHGQPIEFPLGVGRVIQGWDKGLIGMKVGGKRKLTIPGDMAYGAAGSPPVIPPNATLVFEVELVGVN